MFDSISDETQVILMIIGIAILFVAVSWNTKRNKNQLYHRGKRDFRKNYKEKKNNNR